MRPWLTTVAAMATLLSSIGLYPLFDSGGWVWSGLGAILVVVGAGLLVRRFRLAAVFNFLAAMAALHLYLTMRYASAEAVAGVLPTPASLGRLADLMGDGWRAANRYAAPVPLRPGIELLSTLGIGLVAATVDLLAVRLRRAAPAGLPLLAMYSVPAAVREESVSWLAFAAGAAGFLALLIADAREQVAGWGRPVFTRRWSERIEQHREGTGRPERPDAGWPPDGQRLNAAALTSAGRRIGLAAVAIAVALPTIVPGVHPRGLFGMGGSGGRDGSQTVTTPDPLVSLKRELVRTDDAPVLSYTTDVPAPDYLRLYALDHFDGDRWTYSSLQSSAEDRITGRPLPAPPGLTTASTWAVTTRISVQERIGRLTFLPAPYAPTKIEINGDWRVHPESLMVYSLRDSVAGRSYTVTSLHTQPTAAQLTSAAHYPSDILTRYTAVPESVPPVVRRLADQVTKGADSAYEQAIMLQRWFTSTGGFRYDLSAPAPKRGSDLVDFLTASKRGYCEQFAASMALLARILNIPARVAIGYTAGAPAPGGKWVVRSKDAHAWPELFFEGAGWVRFEPTPSGGAGQGTATVPTYSEPDAEGGNQPSQSTPIPSATADPQTSATPSAGPTARNDTGDETANTTTGAGSGGGLPLGWLTGGVLVLLLLAAPAVARALSRRRRWARLPSPGGKGRTPSSGPDTGPAGDHDASAAHAAWLELRADALDHGLSWRSSDSPRAAARRLGELLELDPPAAAALRRLADAEERARYARTPASTATLRSDVRQVRAAFAAGVDRRHRWQARLAPPSTLAAVRDLSGRTLDFLATDRLSTLTTPLKRHLRPKSKPRQKKTR